MRLYTRSTAAGTWTERETLLDSVSVSDEVNARSTARAVVRDQSGALLFGRGTGVRITRKTGDDYWLALPGTSGNYASRSGRTWASDDREFRFRVRNDANNASTIIGAAEHPAKFDFRIFQPALSVLRFNFSPTSSTADQESVSVNLPSGSLDPDEFYRVTFDADGGAGGVGRLTLYSGPSIDGPWAQVATADGADGRTPGDTGSEIQVGAIFGELGEYEMWDGLIYRAQVYDGIDGTLVADFNPDDGAGALTWASGATGETWTVQQSGDPAATIESEELSEDVFVGFIMQSDESRLGIAGERTHTVDAVDLHYLADKRVVVDAYQDTTAGDIVRDIITTHLAGEGLTAGLIQDGPTIEAVTFDYVTAAEAMTDLAERAGFWWRVNPDATVDFAEPIALTTLYAGTENELAGDTNIRAGATGTGAGTTDLEAVALADTLDVQRHAKGYRNRQWVRGGQAKTVTQVETQYGDGERRAFAVGFPIAEEPTVEVSRNGGPFTSQTVGVAGIQTGAFVWSRNSVTLQHDPTETVLTSFDRVRITYTGLFDVIARVDDAPEQGDRATIEGGTGIVERVLTNRVSDSQDEAIQLGGELLAYWTPQATVIRFSTASTTFAPGQTGKFTVDEAGIEDETALVTTVEHYTRGEQERQVVTMVIGPQEGSWAAWFGHLSRRIDRVTERAGGEVEVVTSQEAFTKIWTEAERPNIFAVWQPGVGTVVGDSPTPPVAAFDTSNRVLYLAWYLDGLELGRKAFTTQAGADSDEITTTVILVTTDAVGDIDELAWFGGAQASAAKGSGVEVDRQAFVTTKTDIEQVQVVKTDTKWS